MTKDMINNGVNSDDKSRIIQEYVPGKQITLAHMVTRPKASVYKKLGLPDDYHDAIGMQTLIFIGKMKQLKFLMVALTLLMGISFTSCLNSDDGEYDDI